MRTFAHGFDIYARIHFSTESLHGRLDHSNSVTFREYLCVTPPLPFCFNFGTSLSLCTFQS